MPRKFLGQEVVCPKCNTTFEANEVGGDDSVKPFDEIFEVKIESLAAENIADQIGVENFFIDTGSSASKKQIDTLQLRAQIKRSMDDRVVVARFVAALLFAVGLVNMVPAIYHWYSWSWSPVATTLPRWIFILVFVSVLHLLYSLFSFQVVDWSALRAIAIVTLVFAAVFGFVFTELVLAQIESKVVAFLELPWSLLKTAITWSAAMLVLEMITCYLAAKESFHWQRVERLSHDLALDGLGNGKEV